MEPRSAVAQWSAVHRRADALEHDAEPAHRPLHRLDRDRRARGQAARDRAGSGRRIRQQDRAVSGRVHRVVLRDAAGAPGEVDRDAQRELHRDDARPRSRPGRRAGGHARRPNHGAAVHRVGRHGRLSLDGGARHPDDPARPDAVRAVSDPGGEGRRVRRLHEHDAGGGLSRRRTARGDLHARAAGRSLRARDRHRSGRGAAQEPDSAVRRRTRRRHRPDVRQRQLPGRRSTRRSRTSDYRRAQGGAGAAARRGPLHGDRRHHLRRDLRPRAVAGRRRGRIPGRPLGERDRPLPSNRQGERVHRRHAARPGRRDDVRADSSRPSLASPSTT